ncbi:type VI secretion system lysozyme-like protein [compost metagenome]
MSHGSLLERLSGEATRRKGWSLEQAAMDSVATHLSRMLSTRAGSVQTLPDYGLPDLNDMRLSQHDSRQQARMSIEHFIQAYEPRLAEVQVNALPHGHDPLILSFVIEGLLEIEGIRRKVSFTAQLDGSGQVKVR